MNNKILVFDMDGTIADLYGVQDWLKMLQNEDATPYKVAAPIYNPYMLNTAITTLKKKGWKIVITSWLSKGSSSTYDIAVKQAKIDWLESMGIPYDEIYIVKYGTPKAECTKHHGGVQILIDDDERVRKDWTLGYTIDASQLNIITELLKLSQAS